MAILRKSQKTDSLDKQWNRNHRSEKDLLKSWEKKIKKAMSEGSTRDEQC